MQGLDEDPSPAMTPAEQALLRALAAEAEVVVEFGCGGSTLLLLAACPGRLVTVENDAAWLSRLAARPLCAAAHEANRWIPLHVDQGPLAPWGWPRDPERQRDGAAYVNAPWEAAPRPDLVLVDGRYRLACTFTALARVGVGGRVALHDFWSRPHYRPALEDAELEATSGNLVVLRRRDKPPRDPRAYLSDPR